MNSHNDYLQQFLNKHHATIVEWLSPDASKRRYARIDRKGKKYILMDSPLSEKPREFVKISKLLRLHNIFAPKIYAKNLKHGFLILEDFGSTLLSEAIKNKAYCDELYTLALDTLIRLQKELSKSEINQFKSGIPQMIEETNLFIEYYVPHILKIRLTENAKKEFKTIWSNLLTETLKLPQSVMLYDYHTDNIMLKKNNTLGILDFQDAMKGPIYYDLISLIEDERHPLPNSKRKMLLHHFFDLRPVLAEPKYANWIDVIAAHRHTRVMGIFGRLASVYGKPQYLKYIKNDWAFLRENIKNPLLKDYKKWLQKYLPKQLRG